MQLPFKGAMVANAQGTGYNLHTHPGPTGKLHVVIVDNQIRPILLRSVQEIYIPIHTVGSGKVWYCTSGRPTDWSI